MLGWYDVYICNNSFNNHVIIYTFKHRFCVELYLRYFAYSCLFGVGWGEFIVKPSDSFKSF